MPDLQGRPIPNGREFVGWRAEPTIHFIEIEISDKDSVTVFSNAVISSIVPGQVFGLVEAVQRVVCAHANFAVVNGRLSIPHRQSKSLQRHRSASLLAGSRAQSVWLRLEQPLTAFVDHHNGKFKTPLRSSRGVMWEWLRLDDCAELGSNQVLHGVGMQDAGDDYGQRQPSPRRQLC